MINPDDGWWAVGTETLGEHLARRGVTRRDFLRATAVVAGLMGLGAAGTAGAQEAAAAEMADVLAAQRKPTVVWLQLQECTGCMESVLRSGSTTVEDLVLNLVSLDYNELVMAAAGDAADAALTAANARPHVLVVNGSIPLAEGGIYTTIGGRSAEQVLRDAATNATAIFAVGACAHWGCVQASRPNPTGAVGVDEVITDKQVVNVAGCPPIGEVITASLVYTLTYGKPPPVDSGARPLFAYGQRIHDTCPRRAHFDAGQFVERFDDDAARQGHCLYQVGCRGPDTFAPCPITRWNLSDTFPIGAGHPCLGCTEEDFFDRNTPFYQVLPNVPVPGTSVETSATRIGVYGLAGVGAVVAGHSGLTYLQTKREERAAQRVFLPLLGDLPTRTRPLQDSPAGSGTDEGPAADDNRTDEQAPEEQS